VAVVTPLLDVLDKPSMDVVCLAPIPDFLSKKGSAFRRKRRDFTSSLQPKVLLKLWMGILLAVEVHV